MGGEETAAITSVDPSAISTENSIPLNLGPDLTLAEESVVPNPGEESHLEAVANGIGLDVVENGLLDGESHGVEEWQDNHEMKRVKVYELIGARWVDQGTAFCYGQFQQDTDEALLIARAEGPEQLIILSTTIRGNDVYQRQQETLIVWTEPDGVDYALSFQDPDGCSEVWNFILDVQRHMNNRDKPADETTVTQSAFNSSSTSTSSSPVIEPLTKISPANIVRTGHLPVPLLGNISEIEAAIKALSRTQSVKERVCEYIQHEDYIKLLIDVMHQAEDLESLENLHALFNMMQTILLLNDHSMYEHILEDDIFYGVVGMLEYDPDFPTHKANYRDFLQQVSHFHQPITITDTGIQRKIHHTYRLQFMKDVVLARALDDSTFNVLNSCIIFNQIDIITHIQQDPEFLRTVVSLYVDEEMLTGGKKKAEVDMDVDAPPPKPRDLDRYAFAPPDDMSEEEITQRREVVLLIQQLCLMGKNVQLPTRMALFRALVERGVLFAVQWALGLPESEERNKIMISAAGEILASALDHDLRGVRDHVTKQVLAIQKQQEAKKRGADKALTLLQLLCKMMGHSSDLAVQSQVGDALKVLMEVPLDTSAPIKLLRGGKDDPETEKFLEYFYHECVHILFKPLQDVPEFKNHTEPVLVLTRERTNLYLYLCEMLCNFTSQHSFNSLLFTRSTNVCTRIATLLSARDKHLRHAAFRWFRLSTKLGNRNVTTHFIKQDIFKPLLALTLQESRRDNLLSASCQEFFEHLRKENMKDVIKHCMVEHEEDIRKLAASPLGGERFTSFIRRWEMNEEPAPVETAESLDERRLVGGQDREEDDYFQGGSDDDDDDDTIPSISTRPSLVYAQGHKRKRSSLGGFRPPTLTSLVPQPPLASLVDYGEDEEDDFIGPQPVVEELEASVFGTNGGPPKLPPRTPTPSGPPPVRKAVDEDDDDNMLESLVGGKQSSISLPTTPNANDGFELSVGPMRSSEKRRREEEDDEGLLERVQKVKKVDEVVAPKKLIKLKLGLGASSLGSVPPSPTPTTPDTSEPPTPAPSSPVVSEADSKDGDRG